MSKPGVIIIEGHVQGLSNVRSLGEEGIPVWVIDTEKCVASSSKYCSKFFRCPAFNDDQLADFLIELAKKESIKDWLLMPSNDHAVFTIARNKERLSQYFKLITDDLNIINTIYDKSNLLKIAEKVGVPIPRTHYFTSLDDTLPANFSFPVLTKGKTGLSFYKSLRTKAFLASSKEEFLDQLVVINKHISLSETFTQELIPFDGTNKTLSFTAFCDKGVIKTHWTGVKLREHPIQFGTATFAKSIYVPELLEQSRTLLKELSYTGICEVEYLQDPRTKEYKLIEINARSWLWVGLAKKCGVNYAKIAYDYVNNIPISYPQSYLEEVYWYNPITDSVYSFIGIIKSKVKVTTYLRSIFLLKKENALFQKGDKMPGVTYIKKLFSFYKKR